MRNLFEKLSFNDAKESLKAAAAWLETIVDEGCTDAELRYAEINLRAAMAIYMQLKAEQ